MEARTAEGQTVCRSDLFVAAGEKWSSKKLSTEGIGEDLMKCLTAGGPDGESKSLEIQILVAPSQIE